MNRPPRSDDEARRILMHAVDAICNRYAYHDLKTGVVFHPRTVEELPASWLDGWNNPHMSSSMNIGGGCTPGVCSICGAPRCWYDYDSKGMKIATDPERDGPPREYALLAWPAIITKLSHTHQDQLSLL